MAVQGESQESTFLPCLINLVQDVSEHFFFFLSVCLFVTLQGVFYFLLHTNSLSYITSLTGEKKKPTCRIAGTRESRMESLREN